MMPCDCGTSEEGRTEETKQKTNKQKKNILGVESFVSKAKKKKEELKEGR